MVSKALASLNAWLALAEEVLAEQKADSRVPARNRSDEPADPDADREGAGRV